MTKKKLKMANEFDLLYSEGYGRPSIWKCKGCGIEIKDKQKPRSHVCISVPRVSPLPQYSSSNGSFPSIFLAPGGPTSTPITPAPRLAVPEPQQQQNSRPQIPRPLNGYPFTPNVLHPNVQPLHVQPDVKNYGNYVHTLGPEQQQFQPN